jgi:uncharacterized membrane protein
MNGKNHIQFLKTTVIGGVLFLVPVAVLAIVLGKAIGVMLLVAEPMAAFLPVDNIGGVALANLLALLCVLLLCFLAGLVARIALAGKVIKTLEARVLVNIPGYTMIKGITSGLDPEDTDGLKPILITQGETQRIGLEIERIEGGRSVVYIPSPPSAWSGISQIIPSEQVQYLDVPVMSIIEYTEKFNRGTDSLLSKVIPARH